MKGWVEWFARNPVAANLIMITLILAGLLTAATIRLELFPELSLDRISVSVPYPGAAPEEVEEAICVPIEEEIHSVDGVKEIQSTAVEGMGTILVELQLGADARRVLDDLRTRIDAIDSFPDLAEEPVLEEVLIREQVINVALSGDVDEKTLKALGERTRDEINSLEGITQVVLAGARPYEISIEVSEESLRRNGLTFVEVADAVRASSIDLSGGSIKTEGGEIQLRTTGKAYRGGEFERIPVLTRPDGTRLLLGEVADVVDGFAETDQSSRFNGEPAVVVQVFRVGDQDALDVAAKVHRYVEEARPRLPAGISIETWQDASVFLQERLDTLLRNGLQGLLLVFLVLALFLRFRLAFWVTLGIPVSFLGALWVMPMLGMSVNMLTLFAFILVLGIVVDDAIVVGESVYDEQTNGKPGLEGAISGAKRVAVPVTFAVLTTVAAFVPMLGLPGLMGKFFRVIPMVVIPALLFSLLESKLVLPAHLAHQSRWLGHLASVPPFKWWVAVQTRTANGLERFRDELYRPSLAFALRWRYLTVALAVATLCLTVGVVRAGFVKTVFFDDIEGDFVSADVEMPLGTSAQTTSRAVSQIEAAAARLVAELERDGTKGQVVRNYLASVAEQPYRAQKQMGGPAMGSFLGSHRGEVMIELVPSAEREVTSTEIADRWRELCGPIPGAVDLTFDAGVMDSGAPVDVRLAGQDMDALRAAASELRQELARYDGVYEITDSFRGGKQEIELDVLPGAEALGVSRADLARQVRQGFYGEEAQRIQRGRDEVKVMVRYPREDRLSLTGLERMRVRTMSGAGVPFSAVARATTHQGFATIRRADRERTVDVTANVDESVTTGGDVLASLEADVLPRILAQHRGVSYRFEGQQRDMQESTEALAFKFALAHVAIFALMAVPFGSYLQPLIVMIAIPFGFVGAVIGHLVMGMSISLLSLCGMAALAGVVVNDSLVLVDWVNHHRREGASVFAAASEAGAARFRPIILTSLTTFVGLTPLILEPSVQAQFLIPMAITLAFGVLFSTAISLMLVPACYVILEDLGKLARRVWNWGAPSPGRSSAQVAARRAP